MAVSINTLVSLLEELCQEIEFCLSFQSRPARPSPILVGDFAVDAYNNYLALAKEISDEGLIRSFTEIEKLGDYERPLEREGDWGSDPRMHKMREVSFSAKRLLTLMQDKAETQSQGSEGAIAVIALLEGLGKEIERVRQLGREPIERFDEFVKSLVDTYNRYLEVALVGIEDPVFRGLFEKLDFGEAGSMTTEARLMELGMAQSSLLRYLRKVDG